MCKTLLDVYIKQALSKQTQGRSVKGLVGVETSPRAFGSEDVGLQQQRGQQRRRRERGADRPWEKWETQGRR